MTWQLFNINGMKSFISMMMMMMMMMMRWR